MLVKLHSLTGSAICSFCLKCTWHFKGSEGMHLDCMDFVAWLQKAAHCQWASKHLESKAADQAVWGCHVFDFHICIEVDVLQGNHSIKS